MKTGAHAAVITARFAAPGADAKLRMITVQAVPLLSDNYAWLLRDAGSGVVAIVDPGEAAPVEGRSTPPAGDSIW